MKRFHVHIHVDDLPWSVAFHSRLFAARPGRIASDYAKWTLGGPPEGNASDEQKLQAFRKTLHMIKHRLELLVNLPQGKLAKSVPQGTARELTSQDKPA